MLIMPVAPDILPTLESELSRFAHRPDPWAAGQQLLPLHRPSHIKVPDLITLLPSPAFPLQHNSSNLNSYLHILNFIMAKSAALEKFESIFPTLVEDVLAHSKSYGLPQQALDWFKNVSRPSLHVRTQLTS